MSLNTNTLYECGDVPSCEDICRFHYQEYINNNQGNGDYYIDSADAAVTEFAFSRLIIQTDATLSAGGLGVTEDGVEVDEVVDRNYAGKTLPAGYVIYAGIGKTITHVDFDTGTAEGIIAV